MPASNELQKLQALIDEHALGKPRITNPTVQTRDIKIERADKTHAAVIARWAEKDDPKFVGVEKAKLTSNDVIKWLNESISAYVLVGPSKEILAFANIAPYQPGDLSRVEVGRLLTAPDRRRKGFGSTLVRNLCLAIGATYKDQKTSSSTQTSITLARVVPDNQIGLLFIESLPFSKLEVGPDSKHQWYEYFLNKRNTKIFGEKMESLRRQLRISQAELAFSCGVQRESINMIESGSRTASLDVLWSICRVLGQDQFNRVELLLAAIGETPEPSLRKYQTVINTSPKFRQNLWIATDTLAESVFDIYYEGTKQAIAEGFDRYFFMPPGQWEKSQGEELRDRLETELGSENRANLHKHFRFYEAPEWLCYFRIVVEDPTDQITGKITVGGEEYIRLPLTETQSLGIFRVLNNGMRGADSAILRNKQEAVNGFRRRFPLMKGKSK